MVDSCLPFIITQYGSSVRGLTNVAARRCPLRRSGPRNRGGFRLRHRGAGPGISMFVAGRVLHTLWSFFFLSLFISYRASPGQQVNMAATTVTTAPAVSLLASGPLPAALHAERHATPPPAPSRRLFEAAPTTTTTPKSRVLITSFVVLVNVVQFVSNSFTLVGGLALSTALGRQVGAGQANWMAASYA